MLVDVGRQLLDLRLLVLARQLIGRELRVTIRLVVSLRVGLLHQFHNQILDHLLDLGEGVDTRTRGHEGEIAAAELLGLAVQESRQTLAALGLLRGLATTELHECRRAPGEGLNQLRQILVGTAGNLVALQDRHGLLDSLDLLRADHLIFLKLHGPGMARGSGVRKLLLVLGHARLGGREVCLRGRRIFETLSLGGRLVV
mmetsp:Transcript_81028/g.261845  ORF Transcript_81028/g.261845 Transcript_81028/m.261845 type:complete len:200 (-) Transcript_81028:844-1443(-)